MAVRDHLRSGSAALVSQGITAGSSLVLQVLALWQLGKSGLAFFAILSAGIMVTFNAVHTGLIGDALSVFDRHEPGIRRALVKTSAVSAAASLFVGFFGALLFAERSALSSGLFALALLAWTVEETGRRILMARLEFWKLVVNDAVFAVASLATVGVILVIGDLSIEWLVASMLIGSIASIADAVRQLPREELELGPKAPAEMRRLIEFSGWRAGQIGIRPLSLLVSRIVIVGVASPASLGLLEAARLLIAPVLTAANGLGVFLLPTFAKRAKSDDDLGEMWSIAALSAVAAAVLGTVSVIATPTVSRLLGQDPAIPTTLVASWVVYSIAYCANIPVVNALVARREARSLFNGRLVDAAIGVALSYVLTSMSGIEAVPVGLAIGVVVGTVWPVLRLVRKGELSLPSEPNWLRQVGRAAEGGRRLPRLWPTAWVTILPLLMIIGTEYKFRKRPLSSSLDGSIDVAIILELVIYALVLGYLVMFVVTPPRWRRPTSVQFMLRGYAALMCVSVVYGLYPQLGAVRAVQLVIMVVFAAALANRASRRQMHQLAHGYLALITMSVFLGLIWRVPFSINQEHRFNWMHVHSVIAAAMLALAVVIATAFLIRPRVASAGVPHMSRGIYGFCLVVCTIALIATETRGSLAGAVGGIGVVVFFTLPRRERLPIGVIGLLGVGTAVTVFINPILEYLSRGESTESITTLSNRTLLWDIAFQLVGERPLTGYGLTASRGVFFEAIHLGGAHNAFVNVLVDGGIVAAGLWLGVIVTIGIAIRNAARRRDVDTALLAGLLVTLMVNGLTTEGVGSGSGVSALWLFILAGWVGVMQREWAAHRRSPRVVHRNVVQRTPVRPRSTHPTAPTGDRRRAAIAAAARPTAIGPGPRPEATTALPAGSPAPKALPASPDRPKALEPGTRRPGATSDTAPAPGTQRRGKHFRPPVD